MHSCISIIVTICFGVVKYKRFKFLFLKQYYKYNFPVFMQEFISLQKLSISIISFLFYLAEERLNQLLKYVNHKVVGFCNYAVIAVISFICISKETELGMEERDYD